MNGRQEREGIHQRPRPPGEGDGNLQLQSPPNFCLPGTPRGIGVRTTHPGPPKSASGQGELPSEERDHPQQYSQWSFVFSALQELLPPPVKRALELTEGNSSGVRVFYMHTALSLVFYTHLTRAHVHKRKPRLRGEMSPTQMTRKPQSQA